MLEGSKLPKSRAGSKRVNKAIDDDLSEVMRDGVILSIRSRGFWIPRIAQSLIHRKGCLGSEFTFGRDLSADGFLRKRVNRGVGELAADSFGNDLVYLRKRGSMEFRVREWGNSVWFRSR